MLRNHHETYVWISDHVDIEQDKDKHFDWDSLHLTLYFLAFVHYEPTLNTHQIQKRSAFYRHDCLLCPLMVDALGFYISVPCHCYL